MSDSLKATVIVILLVLTISANDELELLDESELLEEVEPPRLPDVVLVPELDEELLDDELLPESLDPDEPEPELT
jgi:hypothetical protein